MISKGRNFFNLTEKKNGLIRDIIYCIVAYNSSN